MFRILFASVLLLTMLVTPSSAAPLQVGTPGSLWISPAELAALPMSGAAWSNVSAAANGSLGTAQISNQDSNHDVLTLATALVAMRTGNAGLREKAAQAIMSAINTENGGRTLALGRNLDSYVIAADVIRLYEYSPTRNATFRAWLTGVRNEALDGGTLVSTNNQRPNNWGTHAGASRIAADLYLGDTTDLNRAVLVFQGWLGNRSAYAGFKYGDLSWQCNSSLPVGINPSCLKSGHSIGGVLPDDQRRGGGFTWPPPCENYVHGALQGTLISAHLLRRAGYDSWNWSNRAILRSYQWLYSTADSKKACPATGDDTSSPYIVNRAYGPLFPVTFPASKGKSMAWTDWTLR